MFIIDSCLADCLTANLLPVLPQIPNKMPNHAFAALPFNGCLFMLVVRDVHGILQRQRPAICPFFGPISQLMATCWDGFIWELLVF